MNLDSGQGQGRGTEFKERGFGAALSVSLNLANAPSVRRYPYYHVDLNCGSGWNDNARCEGSPLVFLNEAAKVARPGRIHTFLCDKSGTAIEKLAMHPTVLESGAYCINWDNNEVLPVVSQLIRASEKNPEMAVGSLLLDPNGFLCEKTVPIPSLIKFCRVHPRFDLVMNLNLRVYWMGRPHKFAGLGAWATKLWPSFDLFGEIFSRRHWLISNIRNPGGGDHFVIVIGRNLRAGDHQALGIHHMESDKGQLILDRIERRERNEPAPQLAFGF